MANGAPTEAATYWKDLSEADQKMYSEPDFVKKQLKWGTVTVQNWDKFLRSKYRTSSPPPPPTTTTTSSSSSTTATTTSS